MTRPFSIDLGWSSLLTDLGIRRADLLRGAGLPEDIFSRETPVLEPDAYYRLWHAMAEAIGSDTPGLTMGQARPPVSFDPATFAVQCSPDLTTALQRLAMLKPLTGPVTHEVHDTMGGLEVTIGVEGTTLPPELVAAELVELLQIVRLAMREDIRPIAVELTDPPRHPQYPGFFGRPFLKGPFDRIVFSREVAKRCFPAPRPQLFDVFEPDLRPRLDELPAGAPVSRRVRSVLMETLPGGRADAAHVAERLGSSTRSLQRRLAAEGEGFKTLLQDLRERLARHYLRGGQSGAEIAFLLGYDDPNSFIRAFHHWTGTTPEAMRKQLLREGR